ncbi:PRC-barrel domain-containing protein [Chryseobacterium mulctrae]|uniref:PRC-barrel domain-containing protein n=1 Tax=Chryseobacterium mulctrae TaxID=2576777 RepID=UPI00111752C9|nr:PRC-barrel domain-containing protein [Chryseobacterium mulctrae]
MGLQENKYTHLVELGGSDYEIVEGEPDIRGWDVKNKVGLKFGEVDELLFDPQTKKVRYIVVDVNNSELDTEQKKILVPIGTAVLYDGKRIQDNDNLLNRGNENSINEDVVVESGSQSATQHYDKTTYNPYDDGKVVVIPVSVEYILQLPAYEKEAISPETELAIRRIFNGLDETETNSGAIEYKPDEFYHHEHFDEEKFYNAKTSSGIRKKL